MVCPHKGHERQVVDPLPVRRAPRQPTALTAVCDRNWFGRWAVLDSLLEAESRSPGQRGHVEKPPSVALPVPSHDEQSTRIGPLEISQLVGIERHLQQRRDLQPTGQLRVRHLIRPRTQSRRHLDPEKKVRLTSPRAVRKCRLVDDIDA